MEDIIENLILGFMSKNVDHQALNYVCLYAKYYIFINKQFGKRVNELNDSSPSLPRISIVVRGGRGRTGQNGPSYA